MEKVELGLMLNSYDAWLNGEPDGQRLDLSQKDLSGSDLSGIDLRGFDLSRSDLSGVDFSGANLNYTNLSQAHLVGANLTVAKMRNANLRGADLSFSILAGTEMRGADIYNTTRTEVNILDVRAELFRNFTDSPTQYADYPLMKQMLRSLKEGGSVKFRQDNNDSFKAMKLIPLTMIEGWFEYIHRGNVAVTNITTQWIESWLKTAATNIQ